MVVQNNPLQRSIEDNIELTLSMFFVPNEKTSCQTQHSIYFIEEMQGALQK